MFGKLLTTRRNFLIRASAVTAAGATVSVPIVTVTDLRSRCEYHLDQLAQACRDYYGAHGLEVQAFGNKYAPERILEPDSIGATWMVTARLPDSDPRKRRFSRSLDGIVELFGTP